MNSAKFHSVKGIGPFLFFSKDQHAVFCLFLPGWMHENERTTVHLRYQAGSTVVSLNFESANEAKKFREFCIRALEALLGGVPLFHNPGGALFGLLSKNL